MKKNRTLLWLFSLLVTALLMPGSANSAGPVGLAGKKILVVNSYHSTSSAELKIQEGIDEVLKGADLRYFFMDTKKNPENGVVKAKEAFALYKEFEPDVVITTDDNAQSMFVLPYLKDKVDTPVVFCGVNDDASKYGYPTKQITGILEKKHYREGINFAKLISPEIKNLAIIYKDNPSNITNIAQVKREMVDYPVKVVALLSITTTVELTRVLRELQDKVDALLVFNLAGIIGESGGGINTMEGMSLVAQQWPKPSIGASEREIKAGLLCAVAKLNVEQGRVAGTMAKEILNGKPVHEIPVTQNRNGLRVINVTTANKLDVDLKPIVLVGTKLLQ